MHDFYIRFRGAVGPSEALTPSIELQRLVQLIIRCNEGDQRMRPTAVHWTLELLRTKAEVLWIRLSAGFHRDSPSTFRFRRIPKKCR